MLLPMPEQPADNDSHVWFGDVDECVMSSQPLTPFQRHVFALIALHSDKRPIGRLRLWWFILRTRLFHR